MEDPVHSGWVAKWKFQLPSISEVVEKQKLHYLAGGGEGQEEGALIHPHAGNLLAAPTQTRHTNTHDPAIPLGMCPATHQHTCTWKRLEHPRAKLERGPMPTRNGKNE